MALTEKGVLDGRHYEISGAASAGPAIERRIDTTPSAVMGQVDSHTGAGEEDEEGIHL